MSVLTFMNKTIYIAQFIVYKGERVIARLPGIAPGAKLEVPTTDDFTVTASTQLDGCTYTSAAFNVAGPMSFLAQVKQNKAQGTYEFQMIASPSSSHDQMEFQNTCINPVTFLLSRNGLPLQSVIASNSFSKETLAIGNTYKVYAVINGITTDTLEIGNSNAVVVATVDDTFLEGGYFSLSVA